MENVIEFGDLTIENGICDFNIWVNDVTINFLNVPVKHDLNTYRDYVDMPHGKMYYIDHNLDIEIPDEILEYMHIDSDLSEEQSKIRLTLNEIKWIRDRMIKSISYYLLPDDL